MKAFVTFFLIAFLFFNPAGAQEKVYVPFFNCEGLEKGSPYSAAFMFAEFVNEKGAFQAILAQKRDSVQDDESLSLARESAELNSTKYYVYGEVVKFQGTYNVKVTLYATSSGLEFWKSSMLTSNSNDLPVILKDMAYKMATEFKMSQPGDIFLINTAEGEKVNRIKANKSIGFVTGAMIPMDQDEIKYINPGFGGLLSFDLRNFILESTAEAYFGKESSKEDSKYYELSSKYFNLNMNVIYPLNSTNSAPFVLLGSGFSYRELKWEDYVRYGNYNYYDTGFLLNGGGGYILKRNADATLFIYAKGYMFLRDFEDPSYGMMFSLSLQIENW